MQFTINELYDMVNRPGPLWLTNVDLSNANLVGAKLDGADLSNANLSTLHQANPDPDNPLGLELYS